MANKTTATKALVTGLLGAVVTALTAVNAALSGLGPTGWKIHTSEAVLLAEASRLAATSLLVRPRLSAEP